METIRRFRHKTGAIAEKFESFKYEILSGSAHYPVPAWVIEGSADWEEIFEKYTIIEEESSSVLGSEIIAVKRSSDGQIFRVGDMHTGATFTKPREISKISIAGERIVFHQKGLTNLEGYTMLEDAKIFVEVFNEKLPLEDDRTDIYKRCILYINAITYYKKTNMQSLYVLNGFCAYFKSQGYDINDLPELMNQKPGIRDPKVISNWWWHPYDKDIRIKALERAFAEANHALMH